MAKTPHQHARIAVVGAGASGLAAARSLQQAGCGVTVFDKGRGVGGRISTRHTPAGDFDHGGQYFTIRNTRGAALLEEWLADGVVAPWTGRIATLSSGSAEVPADQPRRYVGVPGMNALARHLARGLDVRTQLRVGRIEREGDCWRLGTDAGEPLGAFACLLLGIPAVQAAELLQGPAPELSTLAQNVPMDPCWALLVTFDAALDVPFEAAFVREGPLRWLARDGSKPGRRLQHTWVLHAAPDWTRAHLEDDTYTIERKLLAACAAALGRDLPPVRYAAAHRWRYAQPTGELPEGCVWDPALRIGLCGDWCHGGRVEGALLSGLELADAVAGRAAPTSPR